MTKQETEALLSHLSRRERLEEGIFFTSASLVEQICTHFDFKGINSVIDSAAGSCNFLIPLAKMYPHIQFYGVEKNSTVFNETLKQTDAFENIHYFQGDILLDNFPIPPCDLYLGNPPFVNFTGLPEVSREKTRELWHRYLELPRGFSLLLGNSRADIAQLIFQLTLERYLKPDGRFGVILPDSLLWGEASRLGFQKCLGFRPEEIREVSGEGAFYGTGRHSFYIIGTRGKSSLFPIPFTDNEGKQKELDQRAGKWVISGSPQWPASWMGYYKARQGINTLGANKLFFFKEKPPLDEELLFPLLRSRDIHRWTADPTLWVLLPYREGSLLSEEELQQHYRSSWNYLVSHKKELSARKSRFAQKHWYGLFGIGAYTFAPWRVTWKALGAKIMEAAVVSRGIPNQALHGYISLESEQEAWYLAGLLNSPLMNQEICRLTRAGSKSFGQPGIISSLPLPAFDLNNPLCLKISELAQNHSPSLETEFSNQLQELCIKFLEP